MKKYETKQKPLNQSAVKKDPAGIKTHQSITVCVCVSYVLNFFDCLFLLIFVSISSFFEKKYVYDRCQRRGIRVKTEITIKSEKK